MNDLNEVIQLKDKQDIKRTTEDIFLAIHEQLTEALKSYRIYGDNFEILYECENKGKPCGVGYHFANIICEIIDLCYSKSILIKYPYSSIQHLVDLPLASYDNFAKALLYLHEDLGEVLKYHWMEDSLEDFIVSLFQVARYFNIDICKYLELKENFKNKENK